MRNFFTAALLLSLLVAGLLSPYASSAPDGLEASVGWFNSDLPEESLHAAPLPDYKVMGIDDEATATGLAGVIGTLAVFGLASGLGLLLRRRPGR